MAEYLVFRSSENAIISAALFFVGRGMSRTIHSVRHEALRALLVEERKAAGLTQAAIAKKLNRYQSFVATVESGQRRIDVVEFLDLARAIGFSPVEAIGKLARIRRN